MSKRVLNELTPSNPNPRSGEHCCDAMLLNIENSCKQHPGRYECPDLLLDYVPVFDEYGIIVHDGSGKSMVLISFCPWCGTKLRSSKRHRWFDELEAKGIDTTAEENIPEKYRDDTWWRES